MLCYVNLPGGPTNFFASVESCGPGQLLCAQGRFGNLGASHVQNPHLVSTMRFSDNGLESHGKSLTGWWFGSWILLSIVGMSSFPRLLKTTNQPFKFLKPSPLSRRKNSLFSTTEWHIYIYILYIIIYMGWWSPISINFYCFLGWVETCGNHQSEVLFCGYSSDSLWFYSISDDHFLYHSHVCLKHFET